MPCRASSSASAARSPSPAIRSTRAASGAKSVEDGQAPGLARIGSPERDSRSGMCLDVARTIAIKSTLLRDRSRRDRGRPRAGDRGHMASVTSLYSTTDPCVALAARCRLCAAPLQCHTRLGTYGGTVVATVPRRFTSLIPTSDLVSNGRWHHEAPKPRSREAGGAPGDLASSDHAAADWWRRFRHGVARQLRL